MKLRRSSSKLLCYFNLKTIFDLTFSSLCLKMLKGAVSLVTGGASGLGRAVVERLAQQDGKVVLCDLPKSNGPDVAKQIGENVLFAPMNVTSVADVQAALNLTKEKFGKLDNIINCAGIALSHQTYNFKEKLPHDLEEFRKVINVNTIGTFNVIRLGVGLIGENKPRENGERGVVINTSSIGAFDGKTGQAAYAASKAAIVGITLPLTRDLASEGIRVCTIAPGLFMTSMLSGFPDEVIDSISKATPFPNRPGKSIEFAHLVQSIIENPMLNGEVIRLDGALRLMP